MIPYKELFGLLDEAGTVLDGESPSYRPFSAVSHGPGGLLDFTEDVRVPVLLVPDLHARAAFFARLMASSAFSDRIPGADPTDSVFTLLNKRLLRVVCLGDGFHSETNRERWLLAYDDFLAGIVAGESMCAEMRESLALMAAVMRCKCAFPGYFHFLKGNHENILNAEGGGNHPFRKFAQEGEMVKAFVAEYYGDDILHLFSYFENRLPLIAVCSGCVASHAEPRAAYTRQQLVDGMEDAAVIEGLTWTDNGSGTPENVSAMLKTLLPLFPDAVYVSGHRPVSGAYVRRRENSFIQIHNPLLCNAAFVPTGRPFDPETDILPV
ncbi:hypothetical protein [Treponema brennaborense]|uniref:hypothetical protein n=1 Tax=Treponema brennaborense TaxID=81028 RepID=UPI00145EDD61|nr:hypothetical protein [Treponema brennaborense]